MYTHFHMTVNLHPSLMSHQQAILSQRPFEHQEKGKCNRNRGSSTVDTVGSVAKSSYLTVPLQGSGGDPHLLHQMLRESLLCFPYRIQTNILLGHVYDFKDMIDNFVASPQHKELRKFELSESDWSAICLVKDWLRSFRDATLEMSTTKRATLSHVHAIFEGLQDDLRKALSELPNSAPASIRNGLVNAHCKLSDYYYRIDDSPYYIWAASASLPHLCDSY
jgi:hypothetical protein